MSLSEVSVELPAYGLSSKEKVKSYTENLVKGKKCGLQPEKEHTSHKAALKAYRNAKICKIGHCSLTLNHKEPPKIEGILFIKRDF
jgi:hypothetical protein